MLKRKILSTTLTSVVTTFFLASRTDAFLASAPSFERYGVLSSLGSSISNNNDDGIRCEDREDTVLLLPLLEAKLTQLQGDTSENPDQRSEIEDLQETIDNAKTTAEFGVRRVQAEFYDAFSTCNISKMKSVWSDSESISCVHPGMERLEGSTAVLKSWEQIFLGYTSKSENESKLRQVEDMENDAEEDDDDDEIFRIVPSNVRVEICGRTAICACVEETEGGRLEALNIYRREGGAWKMVNHIATPTMMRFSTD